MNRLCLVPMVFMGLGAHAESLNFCAPLLTLQQQTADPVIDRWFQQMCFDKTEFSLPTPQTQREMEKVLFDLSQQNGQLIASPQIKESMGEFFSALDSKLKASGQAGFKQEDLKKAWDQKAVTVKQKYNSIIDSTPQAHQGENIPDLVGWQAGSGLSLADNTIQLNSIKSEDPKKPNQGQVLINIEPVSKQQFRIGIESMSTEEELTMPSLNGVMSWSGTAQDSSGNILQGRVDVVSNQKSPSVVDSRAKIVAVTGQSASKLIFSGAVDYAQDQKTYTTEAGVLMQPAGRLSGILLGKAKKQQNIEEQNSYGGELLLRYEGPRVTWECVAEGWQHQGNGDEYIAMVTMTIPFERRTKARCRSR